MDVSIGSTRGASRGRRRALGWLGTLAVFAVGTPALVGAQGDTVHVEGQPFDRRVRLVGTDLQLNGTGIRAVAWFKGYAAGLYLPAKAGTAAQAVGMAGPKRLQMRMLQEVPAAEFVKAFKKGVTRNTAGAEMPGLQPRMERFEALITAVGKVRKGDVIDLDLEPGRGTAFSLNGTLRGEVIAGDDFFAALLRSFVGDRPYDEKLKSGLLGRSA